MLVGSEWSPAIARAAGYNHQKHVLPEAFLMSVSARYDGRVLVPDGPVDLPVGRRGRFVPDPDDSRLAGASSDVQEFCAAYDITEPVTRLLQLVRGSMSDLAATHLRIETDPESADSWLVVEAAVKGAGRAVLSEYDAVLRTWIESTDPRARDLVRLTFSLS
jgi:hypothetical protein